MNDRFQGFVFGIRTDHVATIVRDQGVVARVRRFAPPASLAFGLSRKRLLEADRLPSTPVRRSVLVLMGLWAAFGVGFLFTVAAFYFGWSTIARFAGVAASLASGFTAILGTAIAIRRVRKEGPDATLTFSGGARWGDLFPAALTGTELDLLVIGFLLFLIVVLFVLYVVWLPLLVLVLGVLTLGQLWREFRGTLISVDGTDARPLARAAESLLRRGAVLSKSWDPYLGPSRAALAARKRSRLALSYRLLVAVGLSSLAAASLALLSRQIASTLWTYPMAAAIAATAGLLIALTFIAHRNRLTSAPGA